MPIHAPSGAPGPRNCSGRGAALAVGPKVRFGPANKVLTFHCEVEVAPIEQIVHLNKYYKTVCDLIRCGLAWAPAGSLRPAIVVVMSAIRSRYPDWTPCSR